MREKVLRIPANDDEISLYTSLGEALIKTQVVEQALSHSITLKKNPDETKEQADEFLKRQQRYTLGHAIKIANEKKLYNISLQGELNAFLIQRNWLVHNAIIGNEEDFNTGVIKNELLDKIDSIRDKAAIIHLEIEYDILEFCESQGQDMSKFRAILKLQEQGLRIRKQP